jgi:diacylglycerol kinase family enzyme
MKLDLVYNPAAGSFRQPRLDALVAALEAHGFAVSPMATTREGARLSGSAEAVCVHGGDGTLQATAIALGEAAARVPLCVAPSGTINLVARELGSARAPHAFAAQLVAARERGPATWLRSPLYRFGGVPVVSCMSIGPDSAAVAAVAPALKARIGRYAYVVAAARQLGRWPRHAMEIAGETADGEPFACGAEMAIVSRGALYAGPFRLAPKAALAADSVELITLRRSTRARALALSSAAVMRLPIGRLGLAEIRSVRRATIDVGAHPVQIDGEHVRDCAGALEPAGFALTYIV